MVHAWLVHCSKKMPSSVLLTYCVNPLSYSSQPNIGRRYILDTRYSIFPQKHVFYYFSRIQESDSQSKTSIGPWGSMLVQRAFRTPSNEFPQWFAFMVGVLFDFSKNMSASAAHILSELLSHPVGYA